MVEKTAVVGTADGLFVVADVEDGADEVETGELAEWVEDTATGDEIGNGGAGVGGEI